MRLPPTHSLVIDWKPKALEGWSLLVKGTQELEGLVGKSDLYQVIIDKLLSFSKTMDARELPELLKKRIAARALTQLWVDDPDFRRKALNRQILDALVNRQKPHLGIVPLQNLITLYFRVFDRLDELGDGFREFLEKTIENQISIRRSKKNNATGDVRDLIQVLHDQAGWLLSINGPKLLVDYVQRENIELADAFKYFELQGLDSGRYGDICRAHYYLQTLQNIPYGQYDDVFNEILKPTVSKAPYQGTKRIGHIALEILIDRTSGDPGDAWQNFILELAGDPRIASSATNFREWWKPIGESRIEKVRGWLAKEDLRLFLRALEQYGNESGDADLQRMYPARKQFLEGLDKLKLVRRTRLMLGKTAEYAVKKILGNELKTSYVKLTNMHDKAVIFIDCGDFCLIEGSHSFKLWVYLAPPADFVSSYDVRQLTHSDLTIKVPALYRKSYGQNAPYKDITHSPTVWHNRVFDFLAKHGIPLDIEPLLSRNDYNAYLRRFGMPVVSNKKTKLVELDKLK